MNFNNNPPSFPAFPSNISPSESQLDTFLKLFMPQSSVMQNSTQEPPQTSLLQEDRNKACQGPPNNMKALMTQIMMNNYRNYMMMGPHINPLMFPPPNLLNMTNGGNIPNTADLMGMRRNNMMNDMMFQSFLNKFNMYNMFSGYPPMSPLANPWYNMMESFFRNYLRESALQHQNSGLINNSNYSIVNLDNLININNTANSQNEICICSPKKNTDEPIMTCVNESCKSKFHLSCLKYKEGEPECPICFLKKMDPLHQVIKVLASPFLIPASSNVIYKKKIYLDLEVLKEIMEDPDIFLEIRSIRLDEDYKYETSWMDYSSISINDIIILESNPLALNSCLKKRKDEKITIKQYLKAESNEIKFTIKDCTNEEEAKSLRIDKKAEFLVGVYIIRKLTTKNLVSSIKEQSGKNEDECKKFLQEYFSKELTNHTNDIYLDQMKINLLDPIDFQMIQTPVRGRFCRHYSCFSLETFVTIIKDSNPRKWRCPICKKPCYDFQVDRYLLNILNEAKKDKKNIKEIIIFENGKANLVEVEENKEESIYEKENNDDDKEIIPLDLSEKKKLGPAEKEGSLSIDNNQSISQSLENLQEGKNENTSFGKKRRRNREETDKKEGYSLRSKKICVNK